MFIKKYLPGGLTALFAIFFIGANCMAQHRASAVFHYYVSNSGNDNNPGTLSTPFNSIQKINSLNLKPGTVVCFKAGQIFKGSLTIRQGSSGTATSPVVITSYGKGKAVINGDSVKAISLYKTSYVLVKNVKLEGLGRKTGNTENGLAILNSDHIKMMDVDISGFQKSGLLIYSSTHVDAEKISAHDNGSAGITVEAPYQTYESKNIRVINCRAENNPGDPTNLTNHSGNGIVVGDCRQVLIDHCTATNNGWDMPRIGNGPVGIWAYQADSVTIQHCLSYRNKTSKGGADGGGFDLDGGVTNSVIQYCMSYGNQGSGYCIFQYWGASPWHHNVFRYNISENDGTVSDSQAGLYIWNSSGDEKQFYDCDVYGNIIYNDKVAAICFSKVSKSKGLRFYNNIFVGRDSIIWGKDVLGDAKYHDNDWWSINKGFYIDGFIDVKTWAVKTGNEQKEGKITGLNIKPNFNNAGNATITSAAQMATFTNYLLVKNSPLKNKPVFTGRYGVKNIKLK